MVPDAAGADGSLLLLDPPLPGTSSGARVPAAAGAGGSLLLLAPPLLLDPLLLDPQAASTGSARPPTVTPRSIVRRLTPGVPSSASGSCSWTVMGLLRV